MPIQSGLPIGGCGEKCRQADVAEPPVLSADGLPIHPPIRREPPREPWTKPSNLVVEEIPGALSEGLGLPRMTKEFSSPVSMFSLPPTRASRRAPTRPSYRHASVGRDITGSVSGRSWTGMPYPRANSIQSLTGWGRPMGPARTHESRGSHVPSTLHSAAGSSTLSLADYEPYSRTSSMRACERMLVMREAHPFRRFWTLATVLVLLHVGTIFPYRLCFIELYIGEGSFVRWPIWRVINSVVDVFFWMDLVLNFFFSARGRHNREIFNLKVVAVRYLKGWFLINLVACLPPEFYCWLITGLFNISASGRFQKPACEAVTKVSKLVRLSQLSRLLVFRRLQAVTARLLNTRGFSVLNFVLGLFWVAHIAACGWYLCAALHTNAEDTWVFRRGLLGGDPLKQWFHAVYFVMTVFTTVGFGDISASSVAEIAYVCATMVLGTVVHSIIMSRVIHAIMDHDGAQLEVFHRKEMLGHFARHTNLSIEMLRELEGSLIKHAEKRTSEFDRDSMAKLLQGNSLPHALLGELPYHLFQGQLVINNFMTVCRTWSHGSLSPRLALLVSMAVHERYFESHELVYESHDHPWELFLVLKGCFAFVRAYSVGSERSEELEKGADTPSSLSTPHGKKKCMSITEKLAAKRQLGHEFYPYKLLCHQNYFGDFEVMRDVGPRKSNVRCEDLEGGCALALHKNDLADVKDEFPQYVEAWNSTATRREYRRLQLLQQSTKIKAYRALAAVMIQRFIRARRRGCGGVLGNSLVGCVDFVVHTASASMRMPQHARQLYIQNMQLQGEVAELQQSMQTEMSTVKELLRSVVERLDNGARPEGPTPESEPEGLHSPPAVL